MEKMTVEKNELERMITGMSMMCEALEHECFGYNARGVLKSDKTKTEGENAVEYVKSYVDILGGAMRVMSAGLNILSDGLVNDEITITIKE